VIENGIPMDPFQCNIVPQYFVVKAASVEEVNVIVQTPKGKTPPFHLTKGALPMELH